MKFLTCVVSILRNLLLVNERSNIGKVSQKRLRMPDTPIFCGSSPK